ncbi:hypothetical protein DYH09_16470 [bacterium CPR1]|nr:hypothetical protein [bacterium CPR1]
MGIFLNREARMDSFGSAPRIDATFLPANYASRGLAAEFYLDGRLRRFGKRHRGDWTGWVLELSPGLLGTARHLTAQGEQSSEVWADGRAELFGPDGEGQASWMDWEDWVSSWIGRITGAARPASPATTASATPGCCSFKGGPALP